MLRWWSIPCVFCIEDAPLSLDRKQQEYFTVCAEHTPARYIILQYLDQRISKKALESRSKVDAAAIDLTPSFSYIHDKTE